MADQWTHVITGGPWPERIGLRCRIVPDDGLGVYPFDKPKGREVVIFIEDDPHSGRYFGMADEQRGWTCCTDAENVSVIGSNVGASSGGSVTSHAH